MPHKSPTGDVNKDKLSQSGKSDHVLGLSDNKLQDQKLSLNIDKPLIPLQNGSANGKRIDEYPKLQREKKRESKVGFFSLFRFAGGLDIVFMVLGTLGSILLGVTLPSNFVVYGRVIDALLYHVLKDINVSYVSDSYMKEFTPNNTVHEDVVEIVPYFCYIAVAAFVGGFVQMTFWMLAAERQVHCLRMNLFHAVISKQIGWFDQAKIGDITTKLTDDLQTIEAGLSDKVACFIQWSTTFVTGFFLGFLHGWKLTVVILASSPLLLLAGGTSAYIMRRMSEHEQRAYGEAGAVAEEVLSAIRTVTAFGGQDKEVTRYSEQLQKAKSAGIKKGLLAGLGTSLVWTIMLGMFGVAFWYGTKLVGLGEYTGGNVIQVFFGCVIGGFQLGNALPLLQNFANARACAGKIYDIIDQKSEIDPLSTDGDKPEKLHGNISFKNVCFSYPCRPDCQVLNYLSFDVNVGQTVAIVGQSGCGKSTIVKLLQRFYNIHDGEITIDGHKIQELNVQWLREKVGVVSQEPVLFNTSIRENIGYGKEGASKEDILQAALVANAHSFIEDLPLKYDTVVGERGTQLSGGQKQRIAIARAVIRNPNILLLDEATSALDTESEAVVQSALEKASEGRTTLIVAHRLSTIRNADLINVVSKGHVEESGTHEDLMRSRGLYYSLVNKQNQALEKTKKDDFLEEDMINPMVDENQSERQVARDIGDTVVVQTRDTGKAAIKQKDDEGESLSKPSLRRILQLNAPEWPYIVCGSFLALVAGTMHPAFALIMSEFMNNFGATNPAKQLGDAGLLAGMLVMVAVGCGLAFLLQSYFFGIAGENLTLKMRKFTFSAMLKQEIGWFDDPRHTVGALTVQLATDASMIRGAATNQLSNTIQSLSTLLIAIGIAFTFGWKLAFVVVGFFPLIVAAHFFQAKMYHAIGKKNKLAEEEGSRIALEAIQNIRTVATLGRERSYVEKYKHYYGEILRRGRTGALVFGLTQGLAQCVIFFNYAATFAFGSYLLQEGQITFLNLIRVFMSVSLAGIAVGRSSSFGHDLGRAKIAASKMFHLMDRESHIDPSSEAGIKPVCDGEVEFQCARFTYPSRPDVEVLQGLELRILPGQTVALVGSSGCGKTTVVALLERLYDLDSGLLTISGYSCKEMNIQWLRSQLGLVSQEPVLFNTSIKYNIEYGDNTREVTMADIIQAAKMANIHSFVENLPQGYSTIVGDKGIQLSGGQKQRIAIARALIRDPQILLLDEATSALDVKSEQLVQAALDRATEGRTCIVIAHRLSTIQNADTIVVIKDGAVVEQGTHQGLMDQGGVYYRLNEAQKRKRTKLANGVET